MSVDDWLGRHLDLAAQQSASLRQRYGLTVEDRSESNQRYGSVMWSSTTSFVAFFADVWEKYEAVHAGVLHAGGTVPGYGEWLPVDLTCVALGVESRSVLTDPSQRDRDAGLPAWLERQVGLLAAHLTPVLEGDAAFARRARAAVESYTSRPAWRLLGR